MDWSFVMREWVSFAANVCILSITVYTFYITFISKKIKILNISQSQSLSDGNSLSVVIENKSLSPLVIEEVCLIIDNKYKVRIEQFSSPLILEPFSAKLIESCKYSFLTPDIKIPIGKNSALEVKTSRKTLYVQMRKKTPISDAIKSIVPNVSTVTIKYNGKIVPKKAKYVLVLSKYEQQDTIFIFESGAMTEGILGCHQIPAEVTKSQETLENYFDAWLKPKEIKYLVDQVSNMLLDSKTT